MFIHVIKMGFAVLRAKWYLRSATLLGQKIRLWGKPYITNEGQIIIHDRVRFSSTVVPVELGTGPDGIIEIGEGTYINYGASIGATKQVTIGRDCNIGTYVTLIDNDFHRLEPERRHETPESMPIILEDNVWIGAKAIVLRGVRIGTGSVIGAGSVVTKDIPPRSLAAGVPAKVIKQL